MRNIAILLFILAVVSPFAAIFIGPIIERDPAASLYFFPTLAVAIPVGLGAFVALLLIETGEKSKK